MSVKSLCFGLSVRDVCLFVRSSGQILLPRYLMNGLNNFDITYREYLTTPSDDLIRLWSKTSRSYLVNTISHELLE